MSVSTHKQETLLIDSVLTTGFSKHVSKAIINTSITRVMASLADSNILETKGHIIKLIYTKELLTTLKRSRTSPLNCKYLQLLQ